MDLNKKVRAESRNNRSYWPCVTEQDCPFWNVVTIVFIVVSSLVAKGFGTPSQDGNYHDEI